MTLPEPSWSAGFKLTPTAFAAVMAFIVQVIVATSWAVQQQARITAVEVLLMDNMRRSELADRQMDERARLLAERIDRQETPLARRVDMIEARGIDNASRVLTHEGRINELYNLIRRPP